MLHIPKKALLLASKRVLRPQDVFTSNARTGTGVAADINIGFSPNLILTRRRAVSSSTFVFDPTLGPNTNMITNDVNASGSTASSVTAFLANGFSIGTSIQVNSSGATHIDWCWKNQSNFFYSTVVNKPSGVAATVDLSSLGTVGMVIAKVTSTSGNWLVWHKDFPAGQNAQLNSTGAPASAATPISVSGTTLNLPANLGAGTYEIYAFAHQPSGLIQCGSVAATSGATTNVELGWVPQFLLTKGNITADWGIRDTARGFTTASGAVLAPNATAAETAGSTVYKQTATGFSVTPSTSQTVYYLAIKAPGQ